MNGDGTFRQAEITSCGLNGGPLKAEGSYEARIACNLYSREGVKFYTMKTPAGCHPYFTQTGKDRESDGDQYIANFCGGATAGFKYFLFEGAKEISVTLRGVAEGTMSVTDGSKEVASIPISAKTGGTFSAPLSEIEGVKPLYFTFRGKGKPDFLSIAFR